MCIRDRQNTAPSTGVRSILNALCSLRMLKSLSLEMAELKTSSDALDTLPIGFSNLTRLTSLELRFDHMKELGDVFAKRSAEVLCHQRYLTKLTVHFYKTSTSDEGLHEVAQALLLLSRLTEFTFHIYKTSSITDKGCQSITSTVGKLLTLTNLNLAFEGCRGVTDGTLKSLNLSNLSHIKRLDLLFIRTKISDKGIVFLAEQLQYLPRLNHFFLNISRTGISDVGLSQLAFALSSREYLSTLILCFEGCRAVSSLSAEYIVNMLRVRTSLVYVFIEVRRTRLMKQGIECLRGARNFRKYDQFVVITRRKKS
eukprot:TRINITY_DN14106_c0_g2_i1.p1 TRINITY_DN14106_c0_g2~~TRINITY_DN14106_c0_g2_i1.p1  ORF type:complete len:312 (+),score=21.39 TRINITY_DN14106_c0_g2_i1:65-1000(+)